MNFDYTFEKLSDNISVCVTNEHKFGTDAFLLENFAQIRHKDVVCDLGTGCGIIPFIMAKKNTPKKIYAVDIQEKAIEQLKISIEKNNLHELITPILQDLKTLDCIENNSLDVVTCNPPYKANNAGILSELTAEQIARHEVLCTIFDICKKASQMLKFGGKLVICQRPERLADVIKAMQEANIEPKRLRFVSKTLTDAPWLFLIEGKKMSKPFMQVLPQLAVYESNEKNAEFSKEMQEIYGW